MCPFTKSIYAFMYRVRLISSEPYPSGLRLLHWSSLKRKLPRGQVHSTFTRGSNPSVFGGLAGEGQGSRFLCSGCSKIDQSSQKVGLDCQFEKNLNSNQLKISSFWVIGSTFRKVWSIQTKRNWTDSKFWQFPSCKVTLLLQGSLCH